MTQRPKGIAFLLSATFTLAGIGIAMGTPAFEFLEDENYDTVPIEATEIEINLGSKQNIPVEIQGKLYLDNSWYDSDSPRRLKAEIRTPNENESNKSQTICSFDIDHKKEKFYRFPGHISSNITDDSYIIKSKCIKSDFWKKVEGLFVLGTLTVRSWYSYTLPSVLPREFSVQPDFDYKTSPNHMAYMAKDPGEKVNHIWTKASRPKSLTNPAPELNKDGVILELKIVDSNGKKLTSDIVITIPYDL